MKPGAVRVTITKNNDSTVWEGHAALVVVVREEQGQPLPLVGIRGGDATDLVYALAYLMAQVEAEVHPGAIDAALRVKDEMAKLPVVRRDLAAGGKS